MQGEYQSTQSVYQADDSMMGPTTGRQRLTSEAQLPVAVATALRTGFSELPLQLLFFPELDKP